MSDMRVLAGLDGVGDGRRLGVSAGLGAADAAGHEPADKHAAGSQAGHRARAVAQRRVKFVRVEPELTRVPVAGVSFRRPLR